MWLSAPGRMWVLGRSTRRLLWSRGRAAEDPRWSKPHQTHPCSQYFMGQCWITKTCHHETPDLDWVLLQNAVRRTFELPRPPSIHFFSALVARRKLREGSDQKSCLPPPKKKNDAMNSLQPGEHSTCFIYLLLLAGGAAVTDAQNKTPNTWIRKNLTQWQEARKTGGFLLLAGFP